MHINRNNTFPVSHSGVEVREVVVQIPSGRTYPTLPIHPLIKLGSYRQMCCVVLSASVAVLIHS